MFKVYFEGGRSIKVDKQSEVINYLVCHNAIGYEKLNNKSAYEILEEKYKRALKEKNKYKKALKDIRKYIEENVYIDFYGMSIFRTNSGIDDILNIIDGGKNENK